MLAAKAYDSPNEAAILGLTPLIKLREVNNWSVIGFKSFAKTQASIFIELFGGSVLGRKDCLNDFYADAISMRHESVDTGMLMMETLLKFGKNFLSVNYYFAILVLAHTYCLNRGEHETAIQMETLMQWYLSIHKVKAQTAQTWLCKIERLCNMNSFGEAQAQIHLMT